MNDYPGIFDVPPLVPLLLSVLQAGVVFVLVLGGLKAVGRRVFAEQGPQDLVILLLIAEACNISLSDQRAGFWGGIASVATVLFLGWLTERVGLLRRLLDPPPILLYQDGALDRKAMARHMIGEEDLDCTARRHGLSSYREFSVIMLEGDGKVSGIVGTPPPRA